MDAMVPWSHPPPAAAQPPAIHPPPSQEDELPLTPLPDLAPVRSAPRKRCRNCDSLCPTASSVCGHCKAKFPTLGKRWYSMDNDSPDGQPVPTISPSPTTAETQDEPSTAAEPPGKRYRRNRWTITAAHKARLEVAYASTPFPSREMRDELGDELGVTGRQVQVWFQNRRQLSRNASDQAAPMGHPSADHVAMQGAGMPIMEAHGGGGSAGAISTADTTQADETGGAEEALVQLQHQRGAPSLLHVLQPFQ